MQSRLVSHAKAVSALIMKVICVEFSVKLERR